MDAQKARLLRCVCWQIQEAQQTLSAILAVSKSLQDLHQRLASSLLVSTSDSALEYVVDSTEQQTAEVLTLLKRKEERLQIEVNKCAELRAENMMLTKQLQVSTAQQLSIASRSSSMRQPYVSHYFPCYVFVLHTSRNESCPTRIERIKDALLFQLLLQCSSAKMLTLNITNHLLGCRG